ncbi:MAG: bifunctional diaminohydroxyphosphoribosylaminopyrimidine deaminase/5-amino-6-(5-phosphoribosylamino)uracil reductase RibD [Campylobacterales bacterium]
MLFSPGTNNHDFYINLALEAAWPFQCLTYPNPAVGAALLDQNGRLIGLAAHERAGAPHAEVLAFKAGFLTLSNDKALKRTLQNLTGSREIHDFLRAHHNNLFQGGTLYVTLEPCANEGKTPACAPLVADLGIQTLVIGCDDPNESMAGGAMLLRQRGLEVIDGVLKEACQTLIEPFLRWQRGRFMLFKWAQRINGSLDGGQVSSGESLTQVHALRNLCDLMLIGGETVRRDRPTLDSRRVNGRAPDVGILTSRRDFDRSIPLFGVPDRRVKIARDLSLLEDARFVLVEGGPGLLQKLWDDIDWLLIYEAMSFRPGLSMGLEAKAKLLRSTVLGEDLKLWLRPEF